MTENQAKAIMQVLAEIWCRQNKKELVEIKVTKRRKEK